jgi:hypothetical protein
MIERVLGKEESKGDDQDMRLQKDIEEITEIVGRGDSMDADFGNIREDSLDTMIQQVTQDEADQEEDRDDEEDSED